MSDTFRLQGAYSSTPLMGSPSGQPTVSAPVDETCQIINQQIAQYTLASDANVAVGFGGCESVNVLVVKAIGAAVLVEIDYVGDGSYQSVKVDSFLSLICLSEAILAIRISRLDTIETSVRLFLGQYG